MTDITDVERIGRDPSVRALLEPRERVLEAFPAVRSRSRLWYPGECLMVLRTDIGLVVLRCSRFNWKSPQRFVARLDAEAKVGPLRFGIQWLRAAGLEDLLGRYVCVHRKYRRAVERQDPV